PVREGDLHFEGQESVGGILEAGADFAFVAFVDANVLSGQRLGVPAQVGEEVGSGEFPELVEPGFGVQVVNLYAVKVFEVGQKLVGGGAFLPVQGHHLFRQEGKQV